MLTKRYTFNRTTTVLADIISKVRLMQLLSNPEEKIFLMEVKGMSEADAETAITNHPQKRPGKRY